MKRALTILTLAASSVLDTGLAAAAERASFCDFTAQLIQSDATRPAEPPDRQGRRRIVCWGPPRKFKKSFRRALFQTESDPALK